MLIPAFLYGSQTEVRKRVRAMVKRGARAGWDDFGPMLDTATTSGNLVIEGGRGAPVGEHFVVYLLSFELLKADLPSGVVDHALVALCAAPWGVTTLLRGGGPFLLKSPPLCRRFLRAVDAAWDELVALGPRYASAGLPPKELWEHPTSIHIALVAAGVPRDVAARPLTRAGLAPLRALFAAT